MKLPPGRIKWRLSLAAFISGTILCSSCGLFNDYPVISSVQSQKEWVDLSGNSEIECVASDPDGDELTYQWTATDGKISGQGSTVTWTAPNTPGTYAITVKVTDGRGGEATMQQTIDVMVNHPPTIESLAAQLQVVEQGESTFIKCVASDPDGDELTYQWTATDGKISGQGSAVAWTAPDTPDTYAITIKVTDDRGGEASEELTIRVRKSG